MKYILYFLAIIFLLAVNLGVLRYAKLFGVVPNLLLLWLIILAQEPDSSDFFFVAVLGGLLLDSWSGLLFGSFTTVFLVLGFFLHLLRRALILPETYWKRLFLVTIFFSIFAELGLWAYSRLGLHWGLTAILPENTKILTQILPFILYNLVSVLGVYYFHNWLKDFNLKVARLYKQV